MWGVSKNMWGVKMNMIKGVARLGRMVAVVVALLSVVVPSEAFAAPRNKSQVKYVFYFIGDGLGINHVRGTELYNAKVHPEMANGGELSFTRFPVHTFITTHSAASLVTDSAAAGTALATGVKTINGYLGVDAEERSVKNITEFVKERGWKVGICSNVGINHATPSAFYAHCKKRSEYNYIIDRLIESDIDFMAGSTILSRSKSGLKAQDIVEQARAAGIEVLQSADRAAEVRNKRVMLLSDSLDRKSMRFATDRSESCPTIVDFTRAAIRYLEREAVDDGFMLMVEGGHIDYACHDNDAVTTFEEINDFSASIAMAVEFAERHPDQTLIVVTSDHETGGMAIGYSKYKMNMERLAFQRTSEEQLTLKMQHMRESGKVTWEDMQQLLSDYLGLWDKVTLRKKDEETLRRIFRDNFLQEGEKVVGLYTSNEKMAAEAVRILNKRAYVNWIGLSHTGAQVPLFVKGVGYERFMECFDNTDVPKKIAEVIGGELN